MKKQVKIFIKKLKEQGLYQTIRAVVLKVRRGMIPWLNKDKGEADYYLQKQAENYNTKVSWVIPEPFKGSGGHRNIFRMIKQFDADGYQVKIYIYSPSGKFISNKTMKNFIGKNFFELDVDVILGTENIKPCNLLIATHWPTAYEVEKFKHICQMPYYFVQDYEPYFYEMGEKYILADNTYNLGFNHIASGRWCAHKVEQKTGRECAFFDFPIQKDIYKIDIRTVRKENAVVFFARPSMSRRCYNLGVQALEIVRNKMPECEIIFYGEEKGQYGDVRFEFTNLGSLKGPYELAGLYGNSTVGLAFSVTNPSLVPYEMMACGLPVIDIDFNDNSISYGGKQNIVLCAPEPIYIAEQIIELLTNEEKRKLLIANGLKFMQLMPTEEQVKRFVVDTMMQSLRMKDI